MRLFVVSDLHFEFHEDCGESLARELGRSAREAGADVAIVAGDLSNFRKLPRALDLIETHFSIPVVYVTGNHEAWGTSLDGLRAERASRRALDVGDLHWLDCSTVEIKGRRFVGCTLWFPFGKQARHLIMRGWSDVEQIKKFGRDGDHENRRCREFLEREVREGDVVVTHHLPSPRSVPARFDGDPYNCFYVCNCETLINDRRPALWIHGHTHDSRDYELGATRVVCNPFGYRGHETNPAFDRGFIVEIP